MRGPRSERLLPEVPVDDVYSGKAITQVGRNGVATSPPSMPAVTAIVLKQHGMRPGHRDRALFKGHAVDCAL